MDRLMRAARRKTGIAAFERRCRLTSYNHRQCKAWKVPGTAEHGHHAMLQRYTMNVYERLQCGLIGCETCNK